MIKLPVTCKRCGQGPALHYLESKYSGERFFICGECGGMWQTIESALSEPGWSNPDAKEFYSVREYPAENGGRPWSALGRGKSVCHLTSAEYERSVGRPDHYLDAPDYESWTTESWDKYNEPWINCDAEFNAQKES
ncbi:hypothetical protein HNR46_004245 [Haloferula luteola]|uniref:Uncharacterized protein n=1 Tax=Haloferula luteola TaxID=595692 RepID=A0A840VEP4_9BACT|nr:hypothetical protein [Haloferula luteola]MBB5353974.1 hypothetical protein [Haloferula luteola]